MDLCHLTPEALDALAPLVAAHPYGDYRSHRPFPKAAQGRILLSQVRCAAEQGQVLLLLSLR